MAKQLFNAIIVCDVVYDNQLGKAVGSKQFLKYRGISTLEKFKRFAKKFPGITHINFYDAKTKAFIEQIKAADL